MLMSDQCHRVLNKDAYFNKSEQHNQVKNQQELMWESLNEELWKMEKIKENRRLVLVEVYKFVVTIS